MERRHVKRSELQKIKSLEQKLERGKARSTMRNTVWKLIDAIGSKFNVSECRRKNGPSISET